MQLKFRVILNVEEDVLRDIITDSNITLIEFSKIISSEFGFDSSEISTFHHSNENWEQLDEIKIFKIDEEDKIMDKTPISNFFISKGDKLIFIYDFLNYWTFFIELYDLDESIKMDKTYECLNSIGEVPKIPPSDIFNINNDELMDNDPIDDDLIDYDNNHNKKQNTQQHYQEKNFETLSIIEQLMFYYGLIQV